MNNITQMISTGIELGLEIAIQRDQETKVDVYEAIPEPRQWQVGDLVSIGNRPERRLIVHLTAGHVEVIAESGWWNLYKIHGDFPILFRGNTGLVYRYVGREPLYRDFLNGLFTQYFNSPTKHE